jgi:hypothetical protein
MENRFRCFAAVRLLSEWYGCLSFVLVFSHDNVGETKELAAKSGFWKFL